MVEIGGVPLIAYPLGWLKENGITHVILSCGYRWQVLQDYLADGSSWGLDIRYAVEEEPLGRGGGIRHAMQQLRPGHDPIIVANGDNLLDICLQPLLQHHLGTGALVTAVVVPLTSSRGIVEMDEQDRIIRFREKPELPHWINAGLYVFSREAIHLLPEKGDHEDTTFPELAAEGQLFAYRTRELWRTVDTAKDVAEITREVRAGLEVPCLSDYRPDRSEPGEYNV
jgi:NDP-sugar pyrophosphorylase family protein